MEEIIERNGSNYSAFRYKFSRYLNKSTVPTVDLEGNANVSLQIYSLIERKKIVDFESLKNVVFKSLLMSQQVSDWHNKVADFVPEHNQAFYVVNDFFCKYLGFENEGKCPENKILQFLASQYVDFKQNLFGGNVLFPQYSGISSNSPMKSFVIAEMKDRNYAQLSNKSAMAWINSAILSPDKHLSPEEQIFLVDAYTGFIFEYFMGYDKYISKKYSQEKIDEYINLIEVFAHELEILISVKEKQGKKYKVAKMNYDKFEALQKQRLKNAFSDEATKGRTYQDCLNAIAAIKKNTATEKDKLVFDSIIAKISRAADAIGRDVPDNKKHLTNYFAIFDDISPSQLTRLSRMLTQVIKDMDVYRHTIASKNVIEKAFGINHSTQTQSNPHIERNEIMSVYNNFFASREEFRDGNRQKFEEFCDDCIDYVQEHQLPGYRECYWAVAKDKVNGVEPLTIENNKQNQK